MTDVTEGVSEPATLLLEPRDGVPAVTTDQVGLARVIRMFERGSGPVAVDTERASGYRYSQRAYLVQLRRAGAGTALIDPLGCPDLHALSDALTDCEWVLHAATQDLPCLAELGLVPRRLFDTELAARLAGYERVGLAAIVEELLGVRLEKGHSAADWSGRPLPDSWLRYAALDVELLVELRDALHAELARQRKLDWAAEDFAAICSAPPPPARQDPWRRLSGIHRLRGPRQLAIARALWEARDAHARRRDIAPGRVLPDAAIVLVASVGPREMATLAALPPFRGRRMRRTVPMWWAAVEVALAAPERVLPGPVPQYGPPTGRWAERDPSAAARLAQARASLAAIATDHAIPTENLLEPALLRRLAWTPPDPPTAAAVEAALVAGGARAWQRALVTDALAAALTAASAGE
ncbi:MAG: ribonuclease D [Mycobacteriales bacterium]